MDDRDQQELIEHNENETQAEELDSAPAPIQDIEMFANLRDVVRSHYLWKWDATAKDTKAYVKELTTDIGHDPQFRLVGDVEVEEHIFQVTLWLEETMAFSLASVDIMVLDALKIDFSRGAVMARELTNLGLEYHLLTFGEGRAQQFRINIIGPRMQQIRDLGTFAIRSSGVELPLEARPCRTVPVRSVEHWVSHGGEL